MLFFLLEVYQWDMGSCAVGHSALVGCPVRSSCCSTVSMSIAGSGAIHSLLIAQVLMNKIVLFWKKKKKKKKAFLSQKSLPSSLKSTSALGSVVPSLKQQSSCHGG